MGWTGYQKYNQSISDFHRTQWLWILALGHQNGNYTVVLFHFFCSLVKSTQILWLTVLVWLTLALCASILLVAAPSAEAPGSLGIERCYVTLICFLFSHRLNHHATVITSRYHFHQIFFQVALRKQTITFSLNVNLNKSCSKWIFTTSQPWKQVLYFHYRRRSGGYVLPLKIKPDHIDRSCAARGVTIKGGIGNVRHGRSYLPFKAAAPALSATSASPCSTGCSAFLTVSEPIGGVRRTRASLDTRRAVTQAQWHNVTS